MKASRLDKIIYSVLGLKIISSLIVSFTYFRGPHVIRQIDTLAVSMRYYFDLFLAESISWSSFLPKVLSAGDKVGVSPMEFPILNLLISPAFIFGPEYGKSIARLILVIVVIALTFAHYRLWKGYRYKGIDFEKASMLIPIFGVAQIYFEKFMPDFLAFILVSLSVGLCRKYEGRTLLKFFLSMFGLLIKPPAVLAFGPLLLIKPFKEVLKDVATWIFPAFLITVLYYTLGIKALKELMDMEPYFLVHFRSPMQSLVDFFGSPKEVWNLLNKSIFPSYTFVIFAIWDLFHRFKKTGNSFPLELWALFALQILGVVFIDGGHVFVHGYYALSTTFVACFFLAYFLDHSNKRLAIFVTLVLLGYNVECVIQRSKPFWRGNLFTQCEEIRKNTNIQYGQRIRTSFSHWPEIGLCLGNIQNSVSAQYGVYYKNQSPREGEAIFETKDLIVIDHKSEKEK